MITWLQTALGKHHKRILMFMLVVMVVSFVFVIGAVPRGAITGSQQQAIPFMGVNLSDEYELNPYKAGAQETLQLGGRGSVISEQDLFWRITVDKLSDKWQIPESPPSWIKHYIENMSLFQDESGKFDASRYQTIRDDVMKSPSAAQALFTTTISEDARMTRFIAAVSGPGYALPYDAAIATTAAQTKWDIDVATLDFAKFEPKVDVDDKALEAFYNRDIANPKTSHFMKPAEVRLSYVHFVTPASDLQPTPAQLADFIQQNASQFPGVDPAKPGDKTADVTDAWRKAQGATIAARNAADFTRDLEASNAARNSPIFGTVMSKYGAKLETMPPYTPGKGAPAGSPASDEALQAALATLVSPRTFSDPVRVADGAVVLFLDGVNEAHLPKFDEAKADVLAYYKQQEKLKQLAELGKQDYDALQKDVAAGKTFADAAQALGMTVKHYTDVSMNLDKMPEGMSLELFASLADADNSGGVPLLMTLPTGDTSTMLTTSDGGQFVHVVNRVTPPVGSNSPDAKRVLQRIADTEASGNLVILADIIEHARQVLPSHKVQ